jgi:hypothetical protein
LIGYLKFLFYDDLLRFSGSVTVYDKNEQDNLMIRVYAMNLKEEIDLNLKKSIRYCTRMEIWDYQILKWILLIVHF